MKETHAPRDRLLRCTECGTEFLYSASAQRRRQSEQIRELPDLCPGCEALESLVEAAHQDDAPDASGECGRVKWYDRRRGFGFLVGDEGEQFFFHRSSLPRGKRSLRRGAAVRFGRVQGARGLEAVDIHLAGRQPAQPDGPHQIESAEEESIHET
jgi:cold shock CspA family protein